MIGIAQDDAQFALEDKFVWHPDIVKAVAGPEPAFRVLVGFAEITNHFETIYHDNNIHVWEVHYQIAAGAKVWVRALARTGNPTVEFFIRADTGGLKESPIVNVADWEIVFDAHAVMRRMKFPGGRFLQGRGWPMRYFSYHFSDRTEHSLGDPSFGPTNYVPRYGPQTGVHDYMKYSVTHRFASAWHQDLCSLACYGGVWWKDAGYGPLLEEPENFVGAAYPEEHSINKLSIGWTTPAQPWRDSFRDDQLFVEPDRQHLSPWFILARVARLHPLHLGFGMEVEARAHYLLRSIPDTPKGGTYHSVGDHRQQGWELAVLCESAAALQHTRPHLAKKLATRARERFLSQMRVAKANRETQTGMPWVFWGKGRKDKISIQELGIHHFGLMRFLDAQETFFDNKDAEIAQAYIDEIREMCYTSAGLDGDGRLRIPYYVSESGQPSVEGGSLALTWQALRLYDGDKKRGDITAAILDPEQQPKPGWMFS